MVCSMLVVMDVDVSFVSCTVMISGCVVCASCLSFSCLLLTSSMLTCRIFLMKPTLLMEARQEENDSTNTLNICGLQVRGLQVLGKSTINSFGAVYNTCCNEYMK